MVLTLPSMPHGILPAIPRQVAFAHLRDVELEAQRAEKHRPEWLQVQQKPCPVVSFS